MGNAMKMMLLAQGERNNENRARNEYVQDDRRNEYERENPRNEYKQENRRNERGRNVYEDESPEMRRRRDKRGRYMEGDVYSGLYYNGEIGFGNSRRYNEMNAVPGQQRKSAQIGGSLWMQPNEEEEHKLTKEKMHKWVKEMRDDKDKPLEPWSEDEVKPLARRFGYPINGEEFENFYTAIHMMKSDYCSVAEEFDVDTPAFYAALADAWLSDPDAAVQDREKLEAYYKYIVKGKK